MSDVRLTDDEIFEMRDRLEQLRIARDVPGFPVGALQIRCIRRMEVAIDIVADQQKRLRILRGNHVPEFHIAVFVEATAECKTRDYGIGRKRWIGRCLGQLDV